MKIYIKIENSLLDLIRRDLSRPHEFAWERVGFLTAGVTRGEGEDLLIICRSYEGVSDGDYLKDEYVGACIGSNAMRKALQAAYKDKSSLIHIHSHHGKGMPRFSRVDINSGHEFVPSFFNVIPQMPHGMIVLSDNSASGLFWINQTSYPRYVTEFISVGAPYRKFGGHNEIMA